MSDITSATILPKTPRVATALFAAVQAGYLKFAESGLPANLERYLVDRFDLDVTAEYAGRAIPNPWGKGSGQLSMTPRQVAEDVDAGLGFVVLKTVIAEDGQGNQSMSAWAIPEARMVVEPIQGANGETGWTVSWKGRGWSQSFEQYLELVRQARAAAAGSRTLIVPSVKYHLPADPGEPWRDAEYEYTTGHLLKAWREGDPDSGDPMPIEKDFSPTLAGDGRTSSRDMVMDWLKHVPARIRAAVRCVNGEPLQVSPIRVGLKLFNALFDNDFQVEMLKAIHQPSVDQPDYFIYANRLFDPQREFEGYRGIAYGGPDLSDRNLRAASALRAWLNQQRAAVRPLSWSATGSITCGRMAVEYALRGATSFQLHTYFQLPAACYSLKDGSRTQKALHELYFHPTEGFIVWLHHVANTLGKADQPIRFIDLVGKLREYAEESAFRA